MGDRRNDVARLIDGLFATLSVSPHAQRALRARLSGAGRFYHNRDHVALLWARHLGHGGSASETDVAHAIAYHDAIYVAGRLDNETLSTALWLQDSLPCAPALRRQVATMILATRDHLRYAGGDARVQWLLDLDLSTLGDPPDVYARTTAALRREHAALSEEAWRTGRIAFLRGMLAAPALFRCPLRGFVLRRAFEARARRNMQMELAALADKPAPPAATPPRPAASARPILLRPGAWSGRASGTRAPA